MDEKTIDFEDAVLSKYDVVDIEYSEMSSYADDIERIRQVLKSLDIHTSHFMCYLFWSWRSHEWDASWMTLGNTNKEIIQYYCLITNEVK